MASSTIKNDNSARINSITLGAPISVTTSVTATADGYVELYNAGAYISGLNYRMYANGMTTIFIKAGMIVQAASLPTGAYINYYPLVY